LSDDAPPAEIPGITIVPAPIALFAYRRPDHLEQALKALRANAEARDTLLYVFSDGAKNPAVASDVEETRRLLRGIEGFKAVEVVLRDENFGLARNLTSGISDVLRRHDTVIVVEDDICVSPFFLRFMNEALTHYRDEPRVGSISGYCYPLLGAVPETFFIRGADCWGWATWRDRWQVYNPDGRELLDQLRQRKLTRAFDFDNAMRLTQMLKDQIKGKVNSWAIRWHASCFLRDLLILYPGRSLVQNIGHDGTGTHSNETGSIYDVDMSPTPVAIGGIAIEENAVGRAALRDFFQRAYKRSNIFRTIAVAVIDFLGLREFLRGLRSRGRLPRRVL
jgi:hypothetical protein